MWIERWRYLILLSLCFSHFIFPLLPNLLAIPRCHSPYGAATLLVSSGHTSHDASVAVGFTKELIGWGSCGIDWPSAGVRSARRGSEVCLNTTHHWLPVSYFTPTPTINPLFSLALPMLYRGGSAITLSYLAQKCIPSVCVQSFFLVNLPSHRSLYSLLYLGGPSHEKMKPNYNFTLLIFLAPNSPTTCLLTSVSMQWKQSFSKDQSHWVRLLLLL